MSKEDVQSFITKAQGDAALQTKLKTLYSRNQAQAQADLIKMAAEQGFQFTAQDLEELVAEALSKVQQTEGLQDAELESVVGGSVGGWIKASIGTFGIGCIILAAQGVDQVD